MVARAGLWLGRDLGLLLPWFETALRASSP